MNYGLTVIEGGDRYISCTAWQRPPTGWQPPSPSGQLHLNVAESLIYHFFYTNFNKNTALRKFSLAPTKSQRYMDPHV